MADSGWSACSSASASARSAASSFSRPQSRSARRRELANTIVDLCAWIRSSTRSSTCGQIDRRRSGESPGGPPGPAPGVRSGSRSVMSSTGTTILSSMRFSLGGAAIVTGRAPPRNAATSSGGRTVADSPIRWAGRRAAAAAAAPSGLGCWPACTASGPPRRASRRSSDSARCAPRLVPASACTSSTITVSTPRSPSRAFDVSSRNSDSGVVIRMSGGLPASLRRSSAAVSPVRTPTLMSLMPMPSRRAA